MNQIDKISLKHSVISFNSGGEITSELSKSGISSLEITDIFENIADKIDSANQKVRQRQSSQKPLSSRSIKSAEIDTTNIIKEKRASKPNLKFAQLA
jgi:hypothetical protein